MDYYISKTEALDIVRFECGEWSGLAKTIEKRFDYLPHADVQPVVRCKDCNDYQTKFRWCKLHDVEMQPTDFCSKGERRDG